MMNEPDYGFGNSFPGRPEILKNRSLRINSFCSLFDKCGITLVDFKLEFGMYDGRIILADEISPDSCRFWDKATGKTGQRPFPPGSGDVLDVQEVLRRLKNAQQV